MSSRVFKDAVYHQFARIGRALSSPRRLELLDLLAQGARTVEELAGMTGLSVANASHHLKVLREAHLVEGRRQGTFVRCELAGEDVALLWLALRRVGEVHLAEVGALTSQLERVPIEPLVARVQRGEVTLLDVRPPEEYQSGHLPGAMSVPLAELQARIAELPSDREIVAYCRGPYCVWAVEAVRLLREQGLQAVRLEEGVPEWRARGLEVVS